MAKVKKTVLPKTNYVRNPDGIWVNTSAFREEANHFMKYGYYTPEPWGSHAWYEYWDTQLKRCIHGYETGGVKITGHHYFYMNFCNIELVNVDEGLAKVFPNDDYNFVTQRIDVNNVYIKFVLES
jgi:hypothetical protein